MKIKIPHIVFFLMITTFCGCGLFTQKVVYQTRIPRTEDSTTIYKWLLENNIKADGVISVTPESYYTARLFFSSGPMVYTNKGSFLSIGYSKGLQFCPKGVCKVYKIINEETAQTGGFRNFLIYRSVADNRLDTIFPSVNKIVSFARYMNGKTLCGSFFSNNEYKLVIPFSIFWGSQAQVKSIKEYIKAGRENRDRIQIVLLNFDKQFWWGSEWNNQIQVFG